MLKKIKMILSACMLIILIGVISPQIMSQENPPINGNEDTQSTSTRTNKNDSSTEKGNIDCWAGCFLGCTQGAPWEDHPFCWSACDGACGF